MMKSIMIWPFLINMIIILSMMIPSKHINLHPLILLFTLIILTLLISLKINYMYKSWIPFILFLVMIGGLMIIFLYITSLANNELFSFNFNMIKMKTIKIWLLFFCLLYMYMKYYDYSIFYMKKPVFYLNMNNLNLMYMYNKPTLFMMLYLYYSMIIIMNICSINKAPLRQIYL